MLFVASHQLTSNRNDDLGGRVLGGATSSVNAKVPIRIVSVVPQAFNLIL
jgi:hypothetical protein